MMDSEVVNTSNRTTNGTTKVFDLPIYCSYLILIFRVLATLFIVIINVLAIKAIIKIRSQPMINDSKPYTINLLVSGILTALSYATEAGGMIVSCIVDVEDPFRCDILTLTIFTLEVTALGYLLLSFDKAATIMCEV